MGKIAVPLYWLSIALGSLALSFSGCKQKAAAPTPPPPMVTVSTPLSHEVTDWDEYTGHLVSPETANIAARISGSFVASRCASCIVPGSLAAPP